ncbi:hypothetical protein [uncultured Methanobrevibacter sp.]|uniref:hypothetical protein n=1 Tax=uncultured Methanobrevibacter sp. TaxID=253161 RepID=UPI0025FED472|nr:hypothetical protein [uncultured Methanobrevibacter sp.]
MQSNNAEELSDESIYKCSSKLEYKGYMYGTDGLYCPLGDDKYLKISRTDKKYSYSIVEYVDYTFNYLSSAYTCKEAITEHKTSRTDTIKKYWTNVCNDTDIKPILSTIAVDLLNEDNFTQINATFDVYEKEKQKTTTNADDSIDEDIARRKNPKLNPTSKKHANEVETELKSIGLVKYLENQLDKLYKGNHTNMLRKLLGAFKIMRAEGSYIFETIAKAGEGKSLEDEIVFSLMIPKRYIYKVNSITKSSFTRYADKNEYYFDRMILLFGDFGSKKSYGEMEELLNILKVLITEKEYVRDLSDKSDDGNYSNKQLKLKCDSVGGVYSSVINDFTDGDSQLESRTISSTPYGAKEEDIMDFMILLEYEGSEESKGKKEAEKELKKFQKYLLSCVNMDITIINPYGEIFKRHALHSDVPKRELKQVLELFDAYCKLTYFNCENINGHMVASEKQLNEFMQDICLENALIPYESDFLKMIMAENKDTELKIVDTDEEDNLLDECYETVLDEIGGVNAEIFSDLTYADEEKAVKTLLKHYKLGGTALSHEDNVFFRISDIRRQYSKYKAYKNIDNVQTLIHRLVKKGYIDSIEYQDGKQNIYYLTAQCKDIAIPFELTEEDRDSANEFLKKVGIIE